MRPLGWAPTQYDRCPYKKERWPHAGKVCDNRGRDWGDAAVSQWTPRVRGHHQKLERQK